MRAPLPDELRELTLAVEGMGCASCVGRVETALRGVPGVADATVNLATERATLHYVPARVAPQALLDAVRAAGYGARLETLPGADAELKRLQLAAMRAQAGRAAAVALLLMLLAMGGMLWPGLQRGLAALTPRALPRFWDWVQALLASYVMFGPGRRFFRGGWAAWRHASPDMNALVAMGAGAAWGFSLFVLLAPELLPAAARGVYFDSSAVVIAAVLLGKYLEELAKGRASAALRALAGLQAREARVRRDGVELALPIDAVRGGDLIVVRPGERLPVDGVVREGDSYVDEAMLSGEPLPVAKQAGSAVRAGTVNRQGLLLVEAEAVGAATLLAQIVRQVEQAQAGKLPIQRIADRVVLWFTPAVLVLALASFACWLVWGPAPALPHALLAAVAVLVVACPCAMGLATPAAIMVGTGRAAELGVLFRRGEALEALAGIDTVLLDKTGTVTEGRPTLTTLWAVPGFDASQVLAWAAAVEAGSEHPLAHAVLQEARRRGLELAAAADFQASPGQGAQARVAGARVVVGSLAWAGQLGRAEQTAAAQAQRLQADGQSVVAVLRDATLVGLLGISDPPRREARAVIEALRGLRVELVSGDAAAAVGAVARAVGVETTHAGMLPQDKAAVVRRLQGEGRRVLFVGDGINDAPALAQADVGMALAAGTDIAIEAADVTLAHGGLAGLPTALQVARRSMATIRGNLFWAFAYNVLLIPVAAGAAAPWGLRLNPMLAGAAMGLSSLFVLGNSLRLKRLRAWQTGLC